MNKNEEVEDVDAQHLPEYYGQDERSLVKIPFTTIGKGSRRTKPKELKATWQSRVGGKTVKFFKTVSGNARHGLPEFPAEEVYVALMYYSARKGFEDREVRVVPRQLLKLMRWDLDGRAYARLKRSLNQLAGVVVHTNALFNEKTSKFEEAAFGIVDDWRIEKTPDAPLFGEDAGDTLVVRWNEILFAHIRRGRLKLLNVHTYYSMSTPLAKRLYRYMDEAIYPSGKVEIDVCHLAHNRLEMSRSRAYPSSILQSLQPALEELEAKGICSWSMEDSKTDSGKKFVFVRAKNEPSEPDELEDDVPQQQADRWAALKASLAAMDEEEREEIEQEAASRLDPFNRSVWTEKGRRAIGAYQLVLEHMERILSERSAVSEGDRLKEKGVAA